ncbi:hypothetical protein Syun_009775 [Stephania yunnanensis]|uniref:Uncharacterized protein n=1 Tax=Stephania yunnanensis TaxID=152371 RepID=A0AAP0PSL6_9MAGN
MRFKTESNTQSSSVRFYKLQTAFRHPRTPIFDPTSSPEPITNLWATYQIRDGGRHVEVSGWPTWPNPVVKRSGLGLVSRSPIQGRGWGAHHSTNDEPIKQLRDDIKEVQESLLRVINDKTLDLDQLQYMQRRLGRKKHTLMDRLGILLAPPAFLSSVSTFLSTLLAFRKLYHGWVRSTFSFIGYRRRPTRPALTVRGGLGGLCGLKLGGASLWGTGPSHQPPPHLLGKYYSLRFGPSIALIRLGDATAWYQILCIRAFKSRDLMGTDTIRDCRVFNTKNLSNCGPNTTFLPSKLGSRDAKDQIDKSPTGFANGARNLVVGKCEKSGLQEMEQGSIFRPGGAGSHSLSTAAHHLPPLRPTFPLLRLRHFFASHVCLAAPELLSVAYALASAVLAAFATPSPLTFLPSHLSQLSRQISSRISLASLAGSPHRRFTHHRQITSEQSEIEFVIDTVLKGLRGFGETKDQELELELNEAGTRLGDPPQLGRRLAGDSRLTVTNPIVNTPETTLFNLNFSPNFLFFTRQIPSPSPKVLQRCQQVRLVRLRLGLYLEQGVSRGSEQGDYDLQAEIYVREIGEEKRGPLSKAKVKSLKLARHEMKKEVMPQRLGDEKRFKGMRGHESTEVLALTTTLAQHTSYGTRGGRSHEFEKAFWNVGRPDRLE